MSEMEKNCQWHFCEDKDGYSFGAGVAPQKNFKKAAVSASIVRESLQNSIDAVSSYPVRVVFAKIELSVIDYPALFGIDQCSDGNSLYDHYNGIVDSFNENDEENTREYKQKAEYVRDLYGKSLCDDKVPCLRISDYNTTGMDYSPEQNKGSFASFVRSAGRNDKRSKGSAGSCGVGKGAYLLMSQFNTLLVSSRSENETLFEGYMLSVSHFVNGKGFHPYAFYDNNQRRPVCNSDKIPAGFERDEIGTDINIIGIDDSNWSQQVKDMVVAVLKNFWLAIYTEKLVVEIEDVIIDKSHLHDLLNEYFGNERDGVQERTYNPLVYYNIVASESSDKIVHKTARLPIVGDVEFHLNKAKTGNGRILYMRESRMLIFSRIEQMYNQINGVFVCTGEEGNKILKRAENEAHNEWKAKAGDEEAKKAIEEINNYIRQCLEDELGSVTKSTVDIKSLAKRLPISTEPVFDEDYDDELDLDEDGNTVTETVETTEASMIKPHKEKKESVGKVHVRKKKKVSTDQTGDEFVETTGDGDGPELPVTYVDRVNPEPPGPHPGPGPDPSDKQKKSETNQENQDGDLKKPVSINSFEPWAFARKINGEYVYDVRIKCPKEHEAADIIVTIGGEAGDDHIDIMESSVGTPAGHVIKGVRLNKGITTFTMKFKDNEKVSVKLSAYEYKD